MAKFTREQFAALPRFEERTKRCTKCGGWDFHIEYSPHFWSRELGKWVEKDYLELKCQRCGYYSWCRCQDQFDPSPETFVLEIVDNIHEVLAQHEVDQIVPDTFPAVERRKSRPFGFLRRG